MATGTNADHRACAHARPNPAAALFWFGLIFCGIALFARLFPDAAALLGADIRAAWLVFAFGLFLIASSVLLAMKSAGGSP